MGKSFKKLKAFLEETRIKLGNNLGATSRRRTWKITEVPVSDVTKTAVEGASVKVYVPDGPVAKKDSDNRREIDNNGHEKKEEGVRGWKAELLKFKAEAEEFNVELEKAMARRRQHISNPRQPTDRNDSTGKRMLKM